MWPSHLRWGINLRYDNSAVVSVGIAHWFLFLLVFNCWTAILFLRHHRIKRLTGERPLHNSKFPGVSSA